MQEDSFDFVIIGAGGAGEAAAHMARARGASVAIVDRELFGGSCPFWACMPSKTLLHAAAVHAGGGDYEWPKASARRDYMINREGTDWPSDAGHRGHDVFEEVADLAMTAKGYVAEASGHVTIVVDRGTRTLKGAFIAGPAASEVIHEAVLAIKTQTSIDVLADTIHAFPTTARVMGSLFTQALRRIEDAT
ncbi:MAG: FAD-dependent oxidoreductase [Candidatus Limnocylindrales bacterium]